MKLKALTILGLAAAALLPAAPAEAGNVSVGVGIGIGGGGGYYRGGGYCGPRRYYRPYYGAYYYAPVYPYPPSGPYYYAPRAPFANYDDPDPDDWPKENPADRQDHGALLTARAWAALADGRFYQAADLFTDKIDDHPSLGMPRIGYAITAARYGDLSTGVRAMREALHYDPESLRYVPRNDLLDAKYENVLDRYRSSFERAEHQADPAFMIACLEFILGHKVKSVQMLDRALKAGDDSVAAQNLKDLLDARPSKPASRK